MSIFTSMRNIRLSIFLVLFLVSCQDKDKAKIADLVSEWQGKEIFFPERMTYTCFLEDTVAFNPQESKLKVLVYVDSIGCTSCKLQLSKWNKLISQVDSLTENAMPFIFVFQPQSKKELKFILERDNFDYPICMDSEDKFYGLNHFPNDITFQTFLLDENNCVKVIGNPIHNLSVQELYLREIGKNIHSEKTSLTTLESSMDEYSLGVVGKETTKRTSVSVKNTGNNTFKLKGFTTSCDCTEVSCDWEELNPNEVGTIAIRYKAEELGEFYRTVDIYGNTKEPLTLSFTGKVK